MCIKLSPPKSYTRRPNSSTLIRCTQNNTLTPYSQTPYRRDLGDNIEELELGSSSESELDEEFRVEGHSGRRRKGWIAPFLACGDLSAYDADATYALPEGHVPLAPVQPPTAPPYKKALEERRREGGMYGKTKKVAVGRKKERGKEIG